MSWLGLATIAQLIVGMLAPLLPSVGPIYGAYLLGMLAAFIWCLQFGINLMQKRDVQSDADRNDCRKSRKYRNRLKEVDLKKRCRSALAVPFKTAICYSDSV